MKYSLVGGPKKKKKRSGIIKNIPDLPHLHTYYGDLEMFSHFFKLYK